MVRPIVLIDVDGVLGDLSTPWFAAHNAVCPTCQAPLTIDKVKTWDTSRYTDCGKDIYSYLHDPQVWRNVRPIRGARAALLRLNRIANPVVVTSITFGRAIRDLRVAWVRRYFPMIDKDHIVIAEQKECVYGDILIDDRTTNLERHSAHGIIFDYPYNHDWSGDRAYSWPDVETFVRAYLS